MTITDRAKTIVKTFLLTLGFLFFIFCFARLYFLNKKVTYQNKKVKATAQVNDILEASIMKDIELTIFEGELLTRMYAKEMNYQRGFPVRFTRPVIFHFGKDKMTKIQGDWGRMILKSDKLGDMDFKNIKIWGNLRMEQKARAKARVVAKEAK